MPTFVDALAGLIGHALLFSSTMSAADMSLEECRGGDSTRMSDIQAIGSHNSYKIAIPDAELALIRRQNEAAALGLDYSHVPITEQLDLGMRQLELDIFHDPSGGRYAKPRLRQAAALLNGGKVVDDYDLSAHAAPGFKVMHIQDIDFRSHCVLFVDCLKDIDAWSTANPSHEPIIILINAKQGKIEVPMSVTPLPFDAQAFDAFDAEIRSVLSPDRLITPDDVRGDSPTLREAVLSKGWPLLEEARGKIFFALDESSTVVTSYLRDRPSLEGLPVFVKTVSETADHAAYFTINDPIRDGERIKRVTDQGFIVRTRADADTREARANDRSRLDAALSSGAQYISTDYYYPRKEFGDYSARLPGGKTARCRRDGIADAE